jgi:hypothetical protein
MRIPVLCDLGRRDEARRIIAVCESYFRALNSTADLMCVANLAGVLAAEQSQWIDAAAAYRRCLKLAWEGRSRYWIGMALWNLPRSLVRLGNATSAARLMSFGVQFWERNFGALDEADRSFVASVRERLVERLGPAATDELWTSGSRLSLPEAADIALASLD